MIKFLGRSLLAIAAVGSLLLGGTRAEAGYLVAAGDTNIVNGIDGSDIFQQNAGNRTFFANLLGGGTSVKILNTVGGSSVDGVNQLNVLNTFYSGLSNVSSSIVSGPITTALLAGTNLFIDELPDAVLTSSEVSAVKAFLAGGGTFVIFGENQNYAGVKNTYVNTDLTALGSGMQIVGNNVDSSVYTASVANGQILSNPLTANVSTLTYGYISEVSGGTKVLLDSSKNAFVSVESQAVPEPSSLALCVIAGLTGLVTAWKRRKRVG